MRGQIRRGRVRTTGRATSTDTGPRRRRGLRRRVLAGSCSLLTALGVALMGSAPSAQAASGLNGTSLQLIKSYCTRSNPTYWWGMTVQDSVVHPNNAPRGSVYFCMYKYRIADADPSFDYYTIAIQSFWTTTSGTTTYTALMNQSVYSNWAAREDVYNATPTFTSNQSCSTPLQIQFTVGMFAVGVSPQICSGYSVNQISETVRGAAWSTARVGKVVGLETAYAQKIPNGGSTPRFDVQFKVPQYIASWTGNYWHYTAAWQNVTYAGW